MTIGAVPSSHGSVRMILMAAVLVACGGAEGASAPALALVTRLTAGDSLGALERPVAFAGALPCAGCDGVDATLVLHPDGSFRLQERRRSGRGRDTLVTIGRWIIRPESVPALELRGEAPTRSFAILSELRLADPSAVARAVGTDQERRTTFDLARVSAPRALIGTLHARGEFRDFADAATFVTCSGGGQFPIAGDSAFLRLQRTHSSHPLGDGAATRVDLIGRIDLRRDMEEGTLLETIVVDSFTVEGSGAGCEAQRVLATLTVGDWTLTALDGTPLPDLDSALRPSLRFALTDNRIFGSAGCNGFTGRAILRGLDLVGQPVAMTRRACADSAVMARENRYGEILGAGGWFRLDGAELVLARGGTEVARFRRR